MEVSQIYLLVIVAVWGSLHLGSCQTGPSLTVTTSAITTLSQTTASVHMMSLSIGIAIGVCFMLFVVTVCLILVYIFKKKVAICLSGKVERKPRSKSKESLRSSLHSVNRKWDTETRKEHTYVELVKRNEHDRTEDESHQRPNSHEKRHSERESILE